MNPKTFAGFFKAAEKHPAYKKEMATLKAARKKRGRPSKGQRKLVNFRLPVEVVKFIAREAKWRGISQGELVAGWAEKARDGARPDELDKVIVDCFGKKPQ